MALAWLTCRSRRRKRGVSECSENIWYRFHTIRAGSQGDYRRLASRHTDSNNLSGRTRNSEMFCREPAIDKRTSLPSRVLRSTRELRWVQRRTDPAYTTDQARRRSPPEVRNIQESHALERGTRRSLRILKPRDTRAPGPSRSPSCDPLRPPVRLWTIGFRSVSARELTSCQSAQPASCELQSLSPLETVKVSTESCRRLMRRRDRSERGQFPHGIVGRAGARRARGAWRPSPTVLTTLLP
jgi:hypothetical protein